MKRILPCLLLLLAAFAAFANILRTAIDLLPGTHKLEVSTQHPGGFYTTNRAAWCSNNATRGTGYATVLL